MFFTTKLYHNDKLVHSEKLCTLLEWVSSLNRLEPGQKIYIGDIINDSNGKECSTNTEILYVGDCTPYHQPSLGDDEIGWDYKHPRMKKFVLEVYTY